MLHWRLVLGTVTITALVGLCWLDYRAEPAGVVLLPVAIVLSVLGAGELLAMFRARGYQPLAWAIYGGVIVTLVAAAAPAFVPALATNSDIGRLGWLAIGLFAGLILVLVGEMRHFSPGGATTTNLALSAFAILYAGGLMGFLVQLRMIDSPRVGMVALVSLIATVKMSDIGQYTAGRLFGRHKLAPQVSPGKTWEGVVGGVLFAIFGAWCVLHWWGPRLLGGDTDSTAFLGGSVVRTAGYALFLVAAGLTGDLLESVLKRDAGVKDSSRWMPGFGGVLDLVDSLLVAAPVAYFLWAVGFMGP